MIFFNKKANIGNWSPSSLIKNKKVLILGNGPSINENKSFRKFNKIYGNYKTSGMDLHD